VQMRDFYQRQQQDCEQNQQARVWHVTVLGRWMIRLLSLESCCRRPKIRDSVLEGLRERKFVDI